MSADAISQGLPVIPLVLGVAGHRVLPQREGDQARIKELVRKVFDEFRGRYPRTPVILLSPLAKGADRVVAHVALEDKYKPWCRLVVPMPFPEAEYRKDFKKDGSEQEFDQILQRAGIAAGVVSGRLFHVPAPSGADLQTPEARDRQYALVGEFVAHYCQVLIALWDGKPSAGSSACGTGAVVDFKLRSGVDPELSRLTGEPWLPPVRPLDAPQTGPVYHIRVPRDQDDSSSAEIKLIKMFSAPVVPADPRYEQLEMERDQYFQKIYRQIDAFNEGLGSRKTRPEREELLPENELGGLSSNLRMLNNFHIAASRQALFFQDRIRSALFAMCLLGLFGAVFFAVRSQQLAVHEFTVFFTCAYVVCLCIGTVCLVISRLHHWQDRHQDYRALAEGLRVQFFWRLAGLKNWVSDYYLSTQKSEIEWIRNAISNCNLCSFFFSSASPPPFSSPTRRTAEAQKLLQEHWIANQIQYFGGVLDRERTELVNVRNTGEGLIVFGTVLAAVLFGSPPPAADKQNLRPLSVALMFSLVPVVTLFVIKQCQRFRQQRHEGMFRVVSLLKVVRGIAAGLVVCCIIFDLSLISPTAFHRWDSLPGWTSGAALAAALALLAEGAYQGIKHRRQFYSGLSKNVFLRFEQLIVYCWPALLSAIYLCFAMRLASSHGSATPNAATAAIKEEITIHREDVFVVVILITTALGAILNFYADKKGLTAHLRESARMKAVFERAAEKPGSRLCQPDDPDDPVKDLGQEALQENSAWLLTHRERPLEMPKAR